MPFVIGLLVLLTNLASGYNGIVYIFLGILTILFYGIANLRLLFVTMKNEDDHPYLNMLCLVATLAYFGLFIWLFTGFSDSMSHFHPSMSP
jgi:hypothetical protein